MGPGQAGVPAGPWINHPVSAHCTANTQPLPSHTLTHSISLSLSLSFCLTAKQPKGPALQLCVTYSVCLKMLATSARLGKAELTLAMCQFVTLPLCDLTTPDCTVAWFVTLWASVSETGLDCFCLLLNWVCPDHRGERGASSAHCVPLCSRPTFTVSDVFVV